MFTDVIKALRSEAIARSDGHPMAESFVITDNGNLGTDTEDPTYQATGISEVNWKEEKKRKTPPFPGFTISLITDFYYRRTN